MSSVINKDENKRNIMKVIDAVKNRRATKQFDASFQISSEEKKKLIENALNYTPSAFNLQHWRLLVVDNAEQRQALRKVGWDQSQITDSSMLIVLCADLDVWETQVKSIWQDAKPDVRDIMCGAVDAYYRNKPQVQRDEIMRSAGLFAQTLMLLAQEQGYDSCPMDGFDFADVANVINLPSHYQICLMVAIGKGIAEPYPRLGKMTFDQAVTFNKF